MSEAGEPVGRYPRWLREALYAASIAANIQPPRGVYRRANIRPAAFYEFAGIQFVWDTCYSAYALARLGGPLETAQGFIENHADLALRAGPDAGMIPRSVTWEGTQAGQDGSQVPLLAWCAAELFALGGDAGFVRRVYPALAAFLDWWQSPRRDLDGDGLSEYAGGTPTYAAYESGHDFSPERDLVMGEPTPCSADGLVHEPIADVFLNSCLVAELDALARLAAVADPARVGQWRQRRDRLARRIREAMWDEQVGGFFPVIRADLCARQPRVYRHTPALLQPLWAGVATPEQAHRSIETLLGRPRGYPAYDQEMTIRVDPGLYHGYQVRTDGLHPTRGTGAAAGGVQLRTDGGLVCRFGADRGPAAAAFVRLTVEVEVELGGGGPQARVTGSVQDGRGGTHVLLDGAVGATGRLAGELDVAALAARGEPDWLPGLRSLMVSTQGCAVREVRLRYARMDRAGLLSTRGLKSAHPLDGKHPAPGAPTQFWSGTIWGPHQLHACQALARYGRADLAQAIALAYCDATVEAFCAGGDAFEHLCPQTGHGLGIHGYTWGAAIALVLMTEVLGEPPLDPIASMSQA